MNKKLNFYLIIGTVFVSAVGALLHYAYDFSGENYIVGLFTPTSESTWEHMKLLFFPMLLYTPFACYKLKKQYPCISTAFLTGVLAGTLLIPVLFYTYSGILGFNLTWADISIFFLSVAGAFFTAYCLRENYTLLKHSFTLKLIIILFAAGFILFSYNPPDLGIFSNPQLFESYKPENRVVDNIEKLCVNILGNQ